MWLLSKSFLFRWRYSYTMDFLINKRQSLKENDRESIILINHSQALCHTIGKILLGSPPTVLNLQYEEMKTYLWCYLFISEQLLWNTQRTHELGSRKNEYKRGILNYAFQWFLVAVFSMSLQWFTFRHVYIEIHLGTLWIEKLILKKEQQDS